MREIKFRAWNVATKKMIDLKKITPLALNMDTDGLFIPFSDGLPLMQFTGLKDKNGKEIYEGDIVRITGKVMNRCEEFEVKWFEPAFGKVGHGKIIYPLYQSDEQEVIGNIYENPELLKESV